MPESVMELVTESHRKSQSWSQMECVTDRVCDRYSVREVG